METKFINTPTVGNCKLSQLLFLYAICRVDFVSVQATDVDVTFCGNNDAVATIDDLYNNGETLLLT